MADQRVIAESSRSGFVPFSFWRTVRQFIAFNVLTNGALWMFGQRLSVENVVLLAVCLWVPVSAYMLVLLAWPVDARKDVDPAQASRFYDLANGKLISLIVDFVLISLAHQCLLVGLSSYFLRSATDSVFDILVSWFLMPALVVVMISRNYTSWADRKRAFLDRKRR